MYGVEWPIFSATSERVRHPGGGLEREARRRSSALTACKSHRVVERIFFEGMLSLRRVSAVTVE